MATTTELKTGAKAPDFTLADAAEKQISLSDFAGKWLVLYFYPKDNTSGCTVEALDFTAALPEFKKLNAAIVGVSPDSCASHQKFISKHDLKVLLLSDESKQMLSAYGVWQEKSMYGKKYLGVVRTTVLVDPQGVIRHIWPKVKVKGHADEVKETLKALQS